MMNFLMEVLSWLFGAFILALVSSFLTPSDNEMKADFYEKMEQVVVASAAADDSLGGYFASGIINTHEGRALIRAGIKAEYDIEINDWWALKTISIKAKGSDDEYERVGLGICGFTIFDNDDLEEML